MIIDNLFDEILVKPSVGGNNELFIVTGFATAAMAFHHLEYLKDNEENNTRINLIIGMTPQAGLAISNHQGFKRIADVDYPNSFYCSYLISQTPVHSKVYSWYKDGKPNIGFIGSANYTQQAFSNKQKEAMSVISAEISRKYYESLISDSIYCDHPEADELITFYNYRREITNMANQDQIGGETRSIPNMSELESVTVSLLSNGELPSRSGLNWGQRPEQHREPNQAYIRLPADINRSDFFPERGQHFTVLTDDGKILICSRAQDQGKAIHTPHNNSLIGEYFRNRLGVPFGDLVTKEDLEAYGRSDLTFYKIDDETYYLDFSSQ